MLVDIYINQSKNDQASDILRTVLQHNAVSTSKNLMRELIHKTQTNDIQIATANHRYMQLILVQENVQHLKCYLRRSKLKYGTINL